MPYIEAEYESGYIHSDQYQDISPWEAGRNIFNDIVEKRPQAVHGKLVRFSLICEDYTYHIDWTQLPDNARPIRFKHLERDMVGGMWVGESRITSLDFGYQFTTPDGKNVKKIKTIR